MLIIIMMFIFISSNTREINPIYIWKNEREREKKTIIPFYSEFENS